MKYLVNDGNQTDDKQKQVKPQKQQAPAKEAIKFPSSAPTENKPSISAGNSFFGSAATFKSAASISTNGVAQEHLDHAIEVYKNGFDSLNQQGYDFYEYYQSIVQIGIANPQVYTMAFAMGNSMDKSVTKESLLSQADFYSSEIIKVYNDFVSKGQAKKQELVSQKEYENQSLASDLNNLREQMEAIKTQIADRENKLRVIDSKYQPMISEVDSKLGANEIAKTQLLDSIEKVKTGISNNLK